MWKKYTVKCLYLAGRIFRKLAFIRQINFRRKLIHHLVIRIVMYSYIQYTKWCCTSTSRMLIVHSSLSVCMPSKAVSSAEWEMSELVHHDTRQNSKTINLTGGWYASFSTTKSFSSLIAAQSLSRRYDSMCWTGLIRPIMEALVLVHLSPPLPLHTVFTKYFSWNRIFPLIRKIYSPWNISALRYVLVNWSQLYIVTTILLSTGNMHKSQSLTSWQAG